MRLFVWQHKKKKKKKKKFMENESLKVTIAGYHFE